MRKGGGGSYFDKGLCFLAPACEEEVQFFAFGRDVEGGVVPGWDFEDEGCEVGLLAVFDAVAEEAAF